MAFLAELWLPILLSGVFVFVVSSILHMVLPIHKGDYGKLAGEEQILETMHVQNVAVGSYMFPCPGSMKEMQSPEMLEKYKRGPVGFMTVVPSGAPGMGKNLLQWFLYSILVSVFVAYVAHHALEGRTGVTYLQVFQLTGTVAVLAYGVSQINDAIWKGQGWWITTKFVFDGVLYGLTTAGVFGWLWPAAA